METQAGWYWHKKNPDSVTHWDGKSWGNTIARSTLVKAPVYHAETGKVLTKNAGGVDVPAGKMPPLHRGFSGGPSKATWAAGEKNSWPRAILGFGVLIVVGIWWFNAGQQANEPSSTEAGIVCEGFVKNRLKSPSTAEFSGTTAYSSGKGYSATTTVDSQNSFGATLRSTWTCEVTWNQDSQKWLLTAIAQK